MERNSHAGSTAIGNRNNNLNLPGSAKKKRQEIFRPFALYMQLCYGLWQCIFSLNNFKSIIYPEYQILSGAKLYEMILSIKSIIFNLP